MVFCNDNGDDVIIYDSRTGDDGFTLIRLTDKVVFVWLKDGHHSAILDIVKFLYYDKVNYCCKCMK